jgi:hypothetical protein
MPANVPFSPGHEPDLRLFSRHVRKIDTDKPFRNLLFVVT